MANHNHHHYNDCLVCKEARARPQSRELYGALHEREGLPLQVRDQGGGIVIIIIIIKGGGIILHDCEERVSMLNNTRDNNNFSPQSNLGHLAIGRRWTQ